jgi:hypothetical protein
MESHLNPQNNTITKAVQTSKDSSSKTAYSFLPSLSFFLAKLKGTRGRAFFSFKRFGYISFLF